MLAITENPQASLLISSVVGSVFAKDLSRFTPRLGAIVGCSSGNPEFGK
jgi:hypothetical protein